MDNTIVLMSSINNPNENYNQIIDRTTLLPIMMLVVLHYIRGVPPFYSCICTTLHCIPAPIYLQTLCTSALLLCDGTELSHTPRTADPKGQTSLIAARTTPQLPSDYFLGAITKLLWGWLSGRWLPAYCCVGLMLSMPCFC
jgi:hypothetical protein